MVCAVRIANKALCKMNVLCKVCKCVVVRCETLCVAISTDKKSNADF